MKRLAFVTVLLATFGGIVSAQSCGNPEQVLMKIMSDQGLTLLRPARDYVRVGGIVVAPKNGRPAYVDPLDTVPGNPGTVVDIRAIVAGQTKKGATGLGVALSALGKLVAMPVGLTYASDRQVTLAQMDLGGNRLISKGVNTLASATETSKLAKTEIASGSRVFIVQEVYTGTQISLSSASKMSLGVSLGKPGSIPTCDVNPAKKNESGDTKAPAGVSGAARGAKPGTPAPIDTAGRSSDNTAGGAAQQPGTAKAAETKAGAAPAAGGTSTASNSAAADSAKEKPADAGAGDSDRGHSVGLCHSNENSLTIVSTSPIGFAVRLAELQVVNGTVTVKYGSFKFPGSLGSSEAEQLTSTVTSSTLQGLQRRRR